MANYIISNGQLYSVDDLQHYGVKGMKWGVRKDKKSGGTIANVAREAVRSHSIVQTIRKQRHADKQREKQALIEDAHRVTAKAQPGRHLMVPGKYGRKTGSVVHPAYHIVDERGKVKAELYI